MADESRYDRDRPGHDYHGRDYDRDEYRSRDYYGGYGGREDYGRGGYRGDYGYGREGRGWGGYGRREDYGREDYGREGGGYGGYDEGGYGYGREGYGYGGYGRGGNYGRDDFRRRYGEDYGRGGYRRGYYGRDYGGRNEERGWWDRATDEVSSWFGDEDAERRREMDERRGGAWRLAEGGYRGRGPSGYTRSDERIREDVSDRLTDDPGLDASNIEVRVSNGEVTLSGMVNSRWDKRRAEDIADDVSGVKHVQNNLRVRQSGMTTTTAQTAGTTQPGQATPTAANEPSSTRGRTSAA